MVVGALLGLVLVLVLAVLALRASRHRGPATGPPDLRRAGAGTSVLPHDAARRAQGRTSWTQQGGGL